MVLTTDDIVLVDDKYYFVPIEFSALCCMDNNGNIEIVDRIPDESILLKDSYSKIIQYAEELYLVPKNGKCLRSFNIKNGKWKSIIIEEQSVMYKFMDALICENKLIMIGCCYPAILIFDLSSGEVSSYKKVYEEYHESYMKRNDAYFRRGHWVRDGKIYLASSIANEVVEFDLYAMNHKRYEVGKTGDLFDGLLYSGNSFWLAPRNRSEIIEWRKGTDYKSVAILNDETAVNCLYLEPINYNDLILIPAYMAAHTICLSKQGEFFSKTDKQYTLVKQINDVIVSVTKDGYIKEWQNNKEVALEIGNEYLYDYISKCDYDYLKETMINETNKFNLEFFLKVMVNSEMPIQ